MPGYVVIVDLIAALFAAAGFCMAFRQTIARRLIGAAPARADKADDPLTYVLRIAGVMVMVFSLTLGGMLTLFHLV